uniref:Ubiquitin-like domain-containing protein n=1 Tax=Davidia involucrata TaxID=16924 RepID=A0A5B7AQB0_DAVIN
MEEIYQVFVRLLNGKHATLNFTSPSISATSIKHRLCQITTIPIQHQRLVCNGRQLEDQTLISTDGTHLFPTVHLLLRLRGGKGGFGSLLRGAATKAGQKKTNNFDACRDMSGRRLRHVNAEKKLEEWRAEAEERRLEKIAEEFIKKKAKAVKKAGGSGNAEKYVEKYREDSAKCMEVVEKSVRESIASYVNSKRKVASETNGSEAKRLKIWMGKRKLRDSDDEDDSDDDEEEENEESVVINNGNHSDPSKEVEGSSGSVTGGKLDAESSDGGSFESGSEEGMETVITGSLDSGGSPDEGAIHGECNGAGEPALESHEERTVQNRSLLEEAVVSGAEAVQTEKQESSETVSGIVEETFCQPLSISSSGEGGAFESGASNAEVTHNSKSKPVVHEEIAAVSTNVSDMGKPLNFNEFNSPAEMEVLGMERLKSELQTHGLKCGGTLQERAARLFLLKTTPLEMLPKKLLAKK